MSDIQFLDSDKIHTLEQYAASLLTSMISLRSLEQYHIVAMARGIVEEDEAETCKTICWELRRLMNLYLKQYNQIHDRAPIDEKEVMDKLKSIMPDIKKPRKRRNESTTC